MKKIAKLFMKFKIFWYKVVLSNCKNVVGKFKSRQPVLLLGKGKIEFDKNVILGYFPSPYFYSTYCHLDAMYEDASIIIGKNTIINNNFVAISVHNSIKIGDNCLIGLNVNIFDYDFHNISLAKRHDADVKGGSVVIGNNVWLCNDVKILKGVNIGDNSVIGIGSIVTKDVPPNVLVAGNPAKIIREIND